MSTNYWMNRVATEKAAEQAAQYTAEDRRANRIWLVQIILIAIIGAVVIGLRTYMLDGITMIPTGAVLTALIWGACFGVWRNN